MSYKGEALYDLTAYQRDLWLLEQISDNHKEYNVGMSVKIKGELDRDKLREVIAYLTGQYDSLRIQLIRKEGEIYQYFAEPEENWLREIDGCPIDSKDLDSYLKSYLEVPFDLFEVPLFECNLIRTSDEEEVLTMKYHHLIADGHTIYAIFERLFEAYHGEVEQEDQVSYAYLINNSKAYIESKMSSNDQIFWQNYLGRELEPLFPPKAQEDSSQSCKVIKLSTELYESLMSFVKENKTTLYHFIMMALAIQYTKLNNKEELLLGITLHNRKNKKMKTAMGYYVNEVPLHIKVSPTSTVKEALDLLKNALFEVYRHSELTSSGILKGKTVDLSLNYQQYDLDTQMYESKGWGIRNETSIRTGRDLVVHVRKMGDMDLEIEVHYKSHLFGEEKVTNQIVESFPEVLTQMIDQKSISDIEVVSEEHKCKLLHEWNEENSNSDSIDTVYSLFDQVAYKQPDEVALRDCEKTYTYGTLKKEVNYIARGLVEQGVKEGDVVALYLPRKAELVVSIFALWQIGAAYVPLDRNYPADRLNYIISDSGAQYIIVGNEAPSHKLGRQLEYQSLRSVEKPFEQTIGTSDHLAYIIYTSGTTGMPKGVMLKHKQLTNSIKWRQAEYGFNREHTILQVFSPIFDGFLATAFAPLVGGAAVVMPNDEEAKDPGRLRYYINQYQVTHMTLVPSFLKVVLGGMVREDCKSLEVITVAGEKSTADLLGMCSNLNETMEVANEYGPTETAIVATIQRNLNVGKLNHIGKPIKNTKVYILNNQLNLMPIGMPGEIWIAGAGVSEGYIGKAELTAEKFIENPFVPSERMYKSGDLGRWIEPGVIEYLDRTDYQVKIRGYRIELREIEEQIRAIEGIKDVVVVDLGSEEQKYLCGYYVTIDGISPQRIKAILKEKLPYYMIPTYLVELKEMPLTNTGKMDRKQLPQPEVVMRAYEKPITETESLLEEIFKENLRLDQVGRKENLLELGANSLIIAATVSGIYKVFHKDISLRVLFEKPTIEQIAREIEAIEGTQEVIKSNPKKVCHELSSEQKRLYVLEKWQPHSLTYNMPSLTILRGAIDLKRLERALVSVIDKNESLRTRFIESDGIPKQVIREEWTIRLEEIEAKETLIEAAKLLIKPFDLAEDLLIRGAIVKNKRETGLFIDAHHIIFDGKSMEIFLKELEEAYEKECLKAKTIQFYDYVNWEQSIDLEKAEEYWQNVYEDVPEPLELPLDFPRPKEQSFTGESIKVELDSTLVERVGEFVKQKGLTPNMVLLSAYSILLSKYTGQEDLVVGIPTLGRAHSQADDMIGMFARTLPLRLKPQSHHSIEDYLNEVKACVLGSITYQCYPLERLIAKLNIERDPARNPLFDTMFIYQNDRIGSSSNTIYEKQIELTRNTSKFDLSFSVIDHTENMEVMIEYCSDLYGAKTIERFVAHYEYILKQIVKGEINTISGIEMILPDEKEQILGFNQTDTPYPSKTLVDLFESAVEEHGPEIAVIDTRAQLTYDELNERANQLAHYLIEKGIGKEEKIVLKLPRSIGTAVGILGILKAGGAYLPVDIEYPEDRIGYILEDSKAKIVVDELLLSKLPEYPRHNPSIEIRLEHLAYVIYTSGTTGRPKGVMIEHRSAANMLMYRMQLYSRKMEGAEIIIFSPAFDGFVAAFFTPLFNGRKIILPTESEGKDLLALKNYIKAYDIRKFLVVPSLFAAIVQGLDKEELQKFEVITFAGEKASAELIEFCYKLNSHIEVINEYGPTENAVCSTVLSHLTPNKNTIIGKAIANTRAFIVDKNLHIQPVGIKGELAVSGIGVARGYFNNEELTNKKFKESSLVSGERMYLTGDVARWTPSGELEFLGRVDDQVKIRGFRIEIQEIEQQIQHLEGIKEAAVVVRGDQQLYAYYTGDLLLDEEQIKGELKKVLPEYMIPAYFKVLKQMPITHNGKVDKRKLPDIKKGSTTRYEAPVNQEERLIATVWEEVLGIQKVSTNQSFFHIGGDSIKSIQVAAKLMKLGYEVETRAIMRYPTIKGLATQIVRSEEVAPIESIEGEVPLTPIQQWFLNDDTRNPHHFNQCLILEWEEKFDSCVLRKSIEHLVMMHDALRMKFYKVDGKWRQYNQGEQARFDNFHVWEIEKEVDERSFVQEKVAACQETLDIENGPIVRVDCFRGKDRDYVAIIIHHLVVDAVSFRVIKEDLEETYLQLLQGREVGVTKTDSFKMWSETLRMYAEAHKEQLSELSYWEKQEQKIEVKDGLPKVFGDRTSVMVRLDEATTHALLGKVHTLYNTKMNDLLLTALSRSMYKWLGNKEVVIEIEGHGREDLGIKVNTNRTVGWFTIAYPLTLTYYKEVDEQISQLKQTIKVATNKGIDYGVLKYLLGFKDKLKKTPSIGFNYLGVMDYAQDNHSLKISSIPCDNVISSSWDGAHEIDINGAVRKGSLEFEIASIGEQYTPDGIRAFGEILMEEVSRIVTHCLRRLENMPQKFIVKGVEPFKEIFYKDCFYHALFPALKAYEIDQLPYLLNNISTYGYDQSGERGLISVDLEVVPIEDVMNEYGLCTERDTLDLRTMDQLSSIVSSNKLVIIPVDCYELTYRTDTYKKSHWSHTLLIYGYDVLNQTVQVIDHEDIHSAEFMIKKLDFKSLQKAHESYSENFGQGDVTCYILEKNNSNLAHMMDLATTRYELFLQKNAMSLLENIEYLKPYQEDLGRLWECGEQQDEKWQEVLFNLNGMVKSKVAERYKVEKWGLEEDQQELIAEITQLWMIVRNKVQKYILSGKGSKKDVLSKIERIYSLEKKYIGSFK